ncbi:MAG: NAD+ synthase [Deltaproteobacteria bacterium]|nr:NAD+ synthase [Deltaproteobacteria bacterium]
MKLALAQINTTIADFEGNARKILEFAERAARQGVDLVAFPELTLTGYPPRDLVELPGFLKRCRETLEKIAKEAAPSIGLIIGYAAENKKSGGKRAFNAAALIANKKIQQTYHKSLLPTYDVFDEGRTFEAGEGGTVVVFKGKKIGISICEDIWNDKLFWSERLYKRDPIEEQVSGGAELLINISASPYAMGKERLRHEMLQAMALKHGVPIAYVNLVGANDELVFDGMSLGLDSGGKVVAVGKPFEEDLVIWDLEKKGEEKKIPYEGDELATAAQALVVGVRDYVAKCGFKEVVLGLSGGIDSSLVAVIATEALGPKNVHGVFMPSEFSSRDSAEDAEGLAKNLGVSFETIPITSVFEGYKKSLPEAKGVALENIQARIRGHILMALSNQRGSLVLSTGNKSELAVGYCTLYGDMSGGLSVIADLPKGLVYEMARHFNGKRKIIPERVFTKAPTAELRPNQKDQDTLPPYEILDRVLKAFIEDGKSKEEIIALGLEEKVVTGLLRRINANEYKRRQAAPGLKITTKAFGMGRRFPIARKI